MQTELKRINIMMNNSLLHEVDKMAKLRFEDRSTAMRQLVAASIREEKLKTALQRFNDGGITMREAADIAGLSYWEFQQELDKRGIQLMKDEAVARRMIGKL